MREARITARLEHPHIVPVHDFGEIEGPDGRRELFLCMKRIRGRDLAQVLAALARGEPEARETWTRPRLLGVFQGICLGIAYAHSRGVVHRDLKPSNVMLGDFGEVLIVDWGLAKELASGAEDPPPSLTPEARALGPALTRVGDVLGTPSYMSPEQAAGRLSEIDPRTDIFALGAILFEMLTLRPPFTGATADEVLTAVTSGIFPVPSAVASPAAGQVPPELESIVMRAMAFRREDRYTSTLEMHREVQLFIDGVKERERARREARDRAEQGWRQLDRFRELGRAVHDQSAAVRTLRDRIPDHAPLDEKRPLWDSEARLRGLEDERIDVLTRATALFEQGLTADPACARAAAGRCELILDRYVAAETARDRGGMRTQRNLLAFHDRTGAFRERLDAPGRLTLRTWARDCDCLRPSPGLRATFEQNVLVPWRDGRPDPAAPLGDADRPVPALHVAPPFGHRADCPRREIEGVEVWLSRYEEKDKRLVAGGARRLGLTPIFDAGIPQGSWRCELRPPEGSGFHGPVTVPLRIERGADWTQDVNLYRGREIPEGFVQVPGGPFVFGGEWAGGGAAERRTARDFFVSRLAVTCGEYLEFLNDLAGSGRAQEAVRVRPWSGAGSYFLSDSTAGGPPRFRLPGPGEGLIPDIDPRWPAFSIDWFGALAYCEWRSARDGRLYTLLHEEEFEKAARGVDGRAYPWGDEFDGTFSHTEVSLAAGPRMLPVGSYPTDESPCGARDLAGGMCTWCLNAPEAPGRDYRGFRGGAWEFSRTYVVSGYRFETRPEHLSRRYGLRMVFRPEAWTGAATAP